jgi:hypothetical protein
MYSVTAFLLVSCGCRLYILWNFIYATLIIVLIFKLVLKILFRLLFLLIFKILCFNSQLWLIVALIFNLICLS